MLLLCLLAACGKGDSSVQAAMDFRNTLTAASQCTFTADVTADCGGRVYAFTLDCVYYPETNRSAVRVSAPETIAGIAAETDGESGTVTFDGISLELGAAEGNPSPMRLAQLLGEAWTRSYIDAQSREKDGYLVTYRTGYGDGELVNDTRFSSRMTPMYGEISVGGARVLTAELQNFKIS